MPSTPWHSRRLARVALLLGILALAFSVPASAAHVACEHADAATPEPHQCAVCRHLGDCTPLLTAAPGCPAPVLVAIFTLPAAADPAAVHLPPAHGRSPPANVPVS